MKKKIDDTITAIATPFGKGAISIIRISGPSTLNIINKIFTGKTKNKAGIYYGYIIDKNKEKIDEVLLLIRIKPKSYTGEDMAEIYCHGGLLVTELVLKRTIEAGARLAEPGEFSMRAVLNNKIDLTQAEAINEIINAKTEKSLKLSLSHLEGTLSRYINKLRLMLKDILTSLEVSIDHPEEDIEFINHSKMKKSIEEILNLINAMLENAKTGKAFNYGLKIVLIGKANTGKSSLFNALLKKDKAIISDIEGTTRDLVEEWLDIYGIPVKLIDTAGFKNASDIIEKISLEKTEDALKSADIIFFLFDNSKNLDENDKKLIKKVKNIDIPLFIIINKTDLKNQLNIEKIKKELKKNEIIKISAKNGKGINLIENKIKEFILNSNVNNDIIITNVRVENALKKAYAHLLNSIKAIDENIPEEFIASDIRLAINELEEIIGKISSDEILENIFSNFCIGK